MGTVCGTVTTISFHEPICLDRDGSGRSTIPRAEGWAPTFCKVRSGYLDDQNISTLKLDATPQGKPLYEKLGVRCRNTKLHALDSEVPAEDARHQAVRSRYHVD